jgi:outer membrane receptor protein involved in Fe transport
VWGRCPWRAGPRRRDPAGLSIARCRQRAGVLRKVRPLGAARRFNYRSAYLDTLGSSAATDQYTDANGQLDVHVAYQIKPQFTVFGDATNLTDAPWRRYIGSKPIVEREHYGAQLRGGVQVHF